MAFPLILAALGYGIYDRQRREAEMATAMSDPTRPFNEKLNAYINANPGELYRDDVQNMMKYGDEYMKRQTEERQALEADAYRTRMATLSEEEQNKLLRADPDTAARAGFEARSKALSALDIQEAKNREWDRQLGKTDEVNDENRLQDQTVTQQNAAYQAGLSRETNRQNTDYNNQSKYNFENAPQPTTTATGAPNPYAGLTPAQVKEVQKGEAEQIVKQQEAATAGAQSNEGLADLINAVAADDGSESSLNKMKSLRQQVAGPEVKALSGAGASQEEFDRIANNVYSIPGTFPGENSLWTKGLAAGGTAVGGLVGGAAGLLAGPGAVVGVPGGATIGAGLGGGIGAGIGNVLDARVITKSDSIDALERKYQANVKAGAPRNIRTEQAIAQARQTINATPIFRKSTGGPRRTGASPITGSPLSTTNIPSAAAQAEALIK